MTADLPAPFVPEDVDLRDFTFMPVDIVRLFNSEFHAQSTDAEWRAGVTLWLKSYHQVPASSLPDDDIALARLAELGRDLKTWRKIKAGALRGWTRCSDGKLYHRTVAEKALEGWIERLAQRKSSAAGNAKRYGYPFDPGSFDQAMETCRRLLAVLNPQSRVLAKRGGKPTEDAPVGSPAGTTIGSTDHVPGGTTNGTAEPPPDHLPSGSQGTGTGKLSSSLRSEDASTRASLEEPTGKPRPAKPSRKHPFPSDAFDRWYAGYPHKVGPAAARKAFARIEAGDAVAFETLVDAVQRYRRTKPAEHAWCNPATWLNQERWGDEPAASLAPEPAKAGNGLEPKVDLGGGLVAPYSAIRSTWERGRWPSDWGPRPNEPGCRIPPTTMAMIMGSSDRFEDHRR